MNRVPLVHFEILRINLPTGADGGCDEPAVALSAEGAKAIGPNAFGVAIGLTPDHEGLTITTATTSQSDQNTPAASKSHAAPVRGPGLFAMGVSKYFLRALWSRLAPRSFLRFAAASPHELGLAGEELAARYLRSRGWRLLGRRLRTVHGEVDLWAWHAGVSWVVEIKTRRLHEHFTAPPGLEPLAWSGGGVPTLRAAQRERLARAARALARRGAGRPAVALLEVLVSRDSRRVELRGPMEVPWDSGPPPAPSRQRQLGP